MSIGVPPYWKTSFPEKLDAFVSIRYFMYDKRIWLNQKRIQHQYIFKILSQGAGKYVRLMGMCQHCFVSGAGRVLPFSLFPGDYLVTHRIVEYYSG
jgi:hypothetical protein